ncbi:hypothetical protein DFH29DRAFT_154189 [Suillus ampliporus]|nr:hypothetical protein DFH29DRAFT_154189 [Suillus ampliporus]
MQHGIHPGFWNLHGFDTDTGSPVSPWHAQLKTGYWQSSPGDRRGDDSLSRSVLSPSSPVAQHDVRSAVAQTSCNRSGDSPNPSRANDPRLLANTTLHETGQSPTMLLHSHWVSQPDVLHHQLREGMIREQDLSSNDDVTQLQRECLWTNGQGRCGFTAGTVKSMLKHVSSCHLHQPPARRMQCLFGGCSRTMRRDTICRHIREMHYGEKRRS